jgi:outer membrane protein TolC
VGINIGFPIGDIWARKNRKAFQQHELKATEQKREEVKLIISEYVVLAYNTMIYNYRMMSVRYDMMQKAKLDVQLAESDFKTNNMTAAAYTAIQQIYTGTISEYENARKDFLIAMQKLELLLGVKLHTLMK